MKYDLVFEGGGAKGMAFVGALQEFERRGHTSGRLLGTSAGAISATLVAAGYDAAEMLAALNEQVDGHSVFASFLGEPEAFDEATVRNSAIRSLLRDVDIPGIPAVVEDRLDDWTARVALASSHFRHLFSFVERGGWYSSQNFQRWLERKLNSGKFAGQPRAFSGMTLAQFHIATGRELTLIAADTTNARMLILNHLTAPDCPVVSAVRMSMSIPLLWQEVIWQTEWGSYRGKAIVDHAIVDGGLLSGFPLALFISTQPDTLAIMGTPETTLVLGLLIDEMLAVPDVPSETTPSAAFSFGRLRTARRALQLINTMTQGHDNLVIDSFEQLIARMPAKGYGTAEFDMSEARRSALVAAGRNALAAYFDRAVSDEVPFSPTTDPVMAASADNMAARMLAE
jgi:predicted acylesterase/phospholipase RssA